MSLVINSGGLGASASDTAAQCVALGYASYLTNPACWGQSYDDWQSQFYGANAITVTAPAAPGAPSNLTTVPDTTGDTGQALSNAAISATQASNTAANPPAAPDADACQLITDSWPSPFTGMNCSTLALWGVGIFAAFLILPRLIR